MLKEMPENVRKTHPLVHKIVNYVNANNCVAIKIDGAIFDMDGTLLDSMFIWNTIGEEYLLSRGITPEKNLNQIFKSMSLVEAVEYYQNEYGITDSSKDIIDGVNGMIEHFYIEKVSAKEGVKEFLQHLEQCGVKMCVATATDRYLAEAALKRTGLLKFFSEIFTCTEVGSGKDQPLIYETALQHLNTGKSSTYIFEDALYAVKTAKNAGFHVVGVYDESERNHQSELADSSDIYMNSFQEWRTYFEEKGFDNSGF
ncbi:MAG: HAD-IA family hydrolase [Oscillospiraceae bacterium]